MSSKNFVSPWSLTSKKVQDDLIGDFNDSQGDHISHTIHVWYIYLHVPSKNQPNVGIYSIHGWYVFFFKAFLCHGFFQLSVKADGYQPWIQLSSFNQNTAQTNSQTPSEHWRIRKLVVRKPANRKYKPRSQGRVRSFIITKLFFDGQGSSEPSEAVHIMFGKNTANA